MSAKSKNSISTFDLSTFGCRYQETRLSYHDGNNKEYDVEEMMVLLYRRRCAALKVVPCGYYVKHLRNSQIRLTGRALGPIGILAVVSPLPLHGTLISLDLEGNHMGARGAKCLAEHLLEHPSIEDINLANNSIGIQGFGYICTLVERNNNIKCIDISGNNIGDGCAEMLSDAFGDSCQVKSLNIGNNNFGDKVGMAIADVISSNDTLQTLKASWNCIRNKGSIVIANSIKSNIRLNHLDLSWNGLDSESVEVLSEALLENSTLQDLDISGNRLSDESIATLCTGVEGNDGLLNLNVSQNPFTDMAAHHLLLSVQRNENQTLQFLKLKGIDVQDEFIETLKEMKETHPNFSAEYDILPMKKFRVDCIKILLDFISEKELTPEQLFMPKDDNNNNKHEEENATENADEIASSAEQLANERMLLNYEEFYDVLKTNMVPLNETQRRHLAKLLDRRERGFVNLGFIFRKWNALQEKSNLSDDITNEDDEIINET